MNIVQTNQIFSFNYTDYNQSPDLFVAFNIYDATTGTPVFIEKVIADYSANGAYIGSYDPASDKTYLVIGVVYTTDTYTVVDTTRPATSAVFQVAQNGVVIFFGFTYTAYDQAANLDLHTSLYAVTTGVPVFQQTLPISYVAFGVYFGSFTGVLGNSYQVISVAYDGASPDYTRAPSCDEFDSIELTPPSPVIESNNLIDVTELFHDTDFVEGIALVTRIPTVNAHGENIISESTINSIGSVQPASGKTLARLPEALRLVDVSSFWFQGTIVATAAGKYSSILVFKGRRYQVQTVQDWTSWGRGWCEGTCVAELPS